MISFSAVFDVVFVSIVDLLLVSDVVVASMLDFVVVMCFNIALFFYLDSVFDFAVVYEIVRVFNFVIAFMCCYACGILEITFVFEFALVLVLSSC